MPDVFGLFQQMSLEFCVHLTFESIGTRLAKRRSLPAAYAAHYDDCLDGRGDLMLAMMMGVEISQ